MSEPILIILLLFNATDTDFESEKMLFAEANRLQIERKYLESIQTYLKIFEQYPEGRLADDALAQVAKIYEENLFDIPSALKYYEIFLQKYPDSRILKRVLNRYEYLKNIPPEEYQPFTIFHQIKQNYQKQKSEEMIVALEELIRKYPNFSEKAEVLFWLGSEYTKNKKYEKAREYFNQLLIEFPQSDLAIGAQGAIGDTYFEQKKYKKAIAAYKEMEKYPGKFIEKTIKFRAERAERHLIRDKISLFLALFLIFSLLAFCFQIPWKNLTKTTIFKGKWEAIIIALFLVFFEYKVWDNASLFRYSIGISGIGMILFVMLNAIFISTVPLNRVRRILHPFHSLLMAFAIIYIFFHSFDQLIAIENTWSEYGPKLINRILEYILSIFKFHQG